MIFLQRKSWFRHSLLTIVVGVMFAVALVAPPSAYAADRQHWDLSYSSNDTGGGVSSTGGFTWTGRKSLNNIDGNLWDDCPGDGHYVYVLFEIYTKYSDGSGGWHHGVSDSPGFRFENHSGCGSRASFRDRSQGATAWCDTSNCQFKYARAVICIEKNLASDECTLGASHRNPYFDLN